MMTKRKPKITQDPESTAKEYTELPSCTTSQRLDHEGKHDLDKTTVQPGESSKKGKGRRKPNKRTKKKLSINDEPEGEVLVSYKPEVVTLDKLQKDVEEVIDIVRVNVEGILIREGNVEELENAADRLHGAALEFKKTGRGVMIKYWWRNNRCCVGFLILIILVISIGVAVGLAKRFRTQDHSTPMPMRNATTEPFSNVTTSFMPIRMNGTIWPT